MDIATSKEASIKADKEGIERIKVYSDGSALDGQVGAAAVLIRPGKETWTLRYHLGSVEHHTVFEAKLVGLILGLHLIRTEPASRTSIALGTDNQAALTAAATPRNRSGHHLAQAFMAAATNLRKSKGTANYSLTLRWTAGHVNIKGNEDADKEAKVASEGSSSPPTDLPKILKKTLKYNKSAAKQHYNIKLNNIWRREWATAPCARRLNHIDPTLPSSKFLKLTSDPKLSRKGMSWLFQLRTGHFPLNAYLHRFKHTETVHCPACGHHTETPQHFLLDCPAHAHEDGPSFQGNARRIKNMQIC